MENQGVLIGDGVYIRMSDYRAPGAWEARLEGAVLARGSARNITDAIVQFHLRERAGGAPARRRIGGEKALEFYAQVLVAGRRRKALKSERS